MPTEPIPFPIVSAPGRNTHDSAGRLINCYAEPLVNGARGQFVRRRAPGLTSFKLGSYTGWRGGIVIGSLLYAGFTGSGGKIASYTTTGVETLLGSASGTKKLIWARNNKATPDVVFVDPDNGAFQVTTAPSVIAYPDADVCAPNAVCFQDGYFFFSHGDGTVIASAINDTAVNPLDFVKIDGNDGGILRPIPFGQELYLCGTNTVEVWQDTAQSPGFPYSFVTRIPHGLLGRYAISGYEKGFGKGLFFVGDDKIVYMLNGYQLQKISHPDVDRAIASFIDGGGSVEDIEMFPYTVAGHSVVVLRTPAWTWIFDIDNLWWHERYSPDHANWRAYASVDFNGQWLAGDALSANIVQITETTQQELGADLPFILESGPVTAFPNRLRVGQVTIDMARGVGMTTGIDPIQTNPRVYIAWSDDGGMNWSNPIERKLGRQSTSPGPVRVNRCGHTLDQGRRWRVIVYDPVDVELIGGTQTDVVRNY